MINDYHVIFLRIRLDYINWVGSYKSMCFNKRHQRCYYCKCFCHYRKVNASTKLASGVRARAAASYEYRMIMPTIWYLGTSYFCSHKIGCNSKRKYV